MLEFGRKQWLYHQWSNTVTKSINDIVVIDFHHPPNDITFTISKHHHSKINQKCTYSNNINYKKINYARLNYVVNLCIGVCHCSIFMLYMYQIFSINTKKVVTVCQYNDFLMPYVIIYWTYTSYFIFHLLKIIYFMSYRKNWQNEHCSIL